MLAFLFGKRAHVRISFGRYRLSVIRSVLMIGFTPFAIIAVDNVMIIAMNAVLQRYGGAGEGEWVIVSRGSSARFAIDKDAPLDLVIVGIVDHVKAGKAAIYRKNQGE